MPGAMHRMGVYLGLVEDDEYGDADGYGQSHERMPARHDEYAEERYPRDTPRESAGYGREYADEKHPPYVEAYQPTYQITALHPRTYNEARTIGEHFRKNTPVIMNLSDMDDADAKRLVDFAAGLTFGLHGRIERVTAKVFLLSPHNVTVTASGQGQDRKWLLQPVLTDAVSAAWHDGGARPLCPYERTYGALRLREGSAMTLLWGVVGYAIYVYIVLILARIVLDWTRQFARAWRPAGTAAVGVELVYSRHRSTDPAPAEIGPAAPAGYCKPRLERHHPAHRADRAAPGCSDVRVARSLGSAACEHQIMKKCTTTCRRDRQRDEPLR